MNCEFSNYWCKKIAATALICKLTLVTRNSKDIELLGLRLFNPFFKQLLLHCRALFFQYVAQQVGECLLGHKLKSLSDAAAAVLSLASITTWEMLLNHLEVMQLAAGSIEKSDELVFGGWAWLELG